MNERISARGSSPVLSFWSWKDTVSIHTTDRCTLADDFKVESLGLYSMAIAFMVHHLQNIEDGDI